MVYQGVRDDNLDPVYNPVVVVAAHLEADRDATVEGTVLEEALLYLNPSDLDNPRVMQEGIGLDDRGNHAEGAESDHVGGPDNHDLGEVHTDDPAEGNQVAIHLADDDHGHNEMVLHEVATEEEVLGSRCVYNLHLLTGVDDPGYRKVDQPEVADHRDVSSLHTVNRMVAEVGQDEVMNDEVRRLLQPAEPFLQGDVSPTFDTE